MSMPPDLDQGHAHGDRRAGHTERTQRGIVSIVYVLNKTGRTPCAHWKCARVSAWLSSLHANKATGFLGLLLSSGDPRLPTRYGRVHGTGAPLHVGQMTRVNGRVESMTGFDTILREPSARSYRLAA
jgi:hypothetical protein